jgi:guanylate kinase
MLITLTGPSLTGKSTLAKELEKLGCEELVSFTTRPMRANEVDGKTYWFLTHEKIQEYQQRNELMELIELGEHAYGLSKEEFDRVMGLGKVGVLVVAPNGLKQVREYCENFDIPVYSAFVNNDKHVLVKRFLERFKDDSLANVDNYVKRFMQFDEEYIEWTKPALDGEMKYDVILPKFEESNTSEAIATILEQSGKKFDAYAKAKQEKKSKHRP